MFLNAYLGRHSQSSTSLLWNSRRLVQSVVVLLCCIGPILLLNLRPLTKYSKKVLIFFVGVTALNFNYLFDRLWGHWSGWSCRRSYFFTWLAGIVAPATAHFLTHLTALLPHTQVPKTDSKPNVTNRKKRDARAHVWLALKPIWHFFAASHEKTTQNKCKWVELGEKQKPKKARGTPSWTPVSRAKCTLSNGSPHTHVHVGDRCKNELGNAKGARLPSKSGRMYKHWAVDNRLWMELCNRNKLMFRGKDNNLLENDMNCKWIGALCWLLRCLQARQEVILREGEIYSKSILTSFPRPSPYSLTLNRADSSTKYD